MRKNIFIIVAAFVLMSVVRPSFISGQTELSQTMMPSPTSIVLARFGDIPMSFHTGRANISVPIYNTTQLGVPLNINLSYDTSGIIASSLPSWTGYGWSLNTGGVITRVINNGCDELDYHGMGKDNWHNYFSNPNKLTEYVNNYNSSHGSNRLHELVFQNMICGEYDYNPDVFYFNFMGKTGRFFYGGDGQWHVYSDENLYVEFDVNDSQNYLYPYFKNLVYNDYGGATSQQLKTIKGFTIVDENGIRYKFGGSCNQNNNSSSSLETRANAIEYSIPFMYATRKNTINNTEVAMNASAWYLTEIQNRFGVPLYKFEYQRGKFVVQINDILETAYISGRGWHVIYKDITTTEDFPFALCLNSPVYLKKITMPLDSTEIEFNQILDLELSSHDFYQRFYDYLEPSSSNQNQSVFMKLQTMVGCNNSYAEYNVFSLLQTNNSLITPYQNSGNQTNKHIDPIGSMSISPLKEMNIKHNGLITSQIKFDYSDTQSQRLFLTHVRIKDADLESVGKYDFDYYNPSGLAKDVLSVPTDDWGYYTTNSQRDPELSATKCGMLTQIKYPTGGITDIDYELNHYSKVISDDKQSYNYEVGYAGGLRVSSIKNYNDETKTKLLSQKDYTYDDGELYAKPKRIWSNWVARDYDGGYISISFHRYNSIVPLCNSFGPHIGYSKVTERFHDGTYKVYRYTNMSDCHDALPCISAHSGSSPYDAFSERGYKRGRLLSDSLFSSSGTLLSSTTNTYRTDNIESKYVYASNLSAQTLRNANSAAYTYYIGGVYKMFYPKYDLIRVEKSTRYGNRYIKERIVYNKQDYTLDINVLSGHTQKAEIRKCLSETVQQINNNGIVDSYETQYAFPLTDGNLLSQFFLPCVKSTDFRNGNRIKSKETLYGTISGLYVPAYEKEYVGNNAGMTYMTYNSYMPDGQIETYTKKGERKVKLFYDHCHRLAANVTCTSGYEDVIYNEYATDPSRIITKGGNSIFSCPMTKATIYTYNDRGLMGSATMNNGQTMQYNYDAMGQLSEIRDVNNNIIQKFTYNLTNK